MTSRFHRLGRPLACLLILVPVLMGFHYVYAYGVNMVWEDQLDSMTHLFEKWYAGTLGFGDFWELCNEHRHVIPRFVLFVVDILTRWNTLAEMYFTQTLLAAALGIFACVFRRTCASEGYLWLLIPIAFLVFSLRQCQNLLFGYQLVFVLTAVEALAAFLCLYLLNDPRRLVLKYGAALILATLTAFSGAQGLLVWPVGLLPLALLPLTWRPRIILAAIWAAVGAIEWIVYFMDFHGPGLPGPTLSWYPATLAGGALFPVVLVATIAGVAILILAAVSVVLTFKEGKGSLYSFWLAVLAFAVATEVQISVGRSGFGLGQALSSRYATFSILAVISVYGMLSCLMVVKGGRLVSALWGALACLVAVGVVASMDEGYEIAAQWKAARQYHAFIFLTSESQPDEALPTCYWQQPPSMHRDIAFLKAHGWNVFASPERAAPYALPPRDWPALPYAARLTLNPLGLDRSTGLVTVAGYAVDATLTDVVGGVFLEVDGALYPAYYGLPREDAVEALKSDRVRDSGFHRTFSVRQLGVGRHHLVIKALTKDRSAFYRPPEPVEFTITQQ